MGIFQQFPYTNFHEMNLDQIIKIMREMQDEWEATKTEWASYKDFIDNYFNNLDVSAEVLNAIRVLAATGELNNIIDPVIIANVTEWLENNIELTSPAIDDSLTIAGAGADAKVTGNRIRGIEFNLSTYDSFSVVEPYAERASGTHNGITFTWSNRTCSVSGTATGTAVNNIVDRRPVVGVLTPGKTYFARYHTTDSRVSMNCVFYDVNNVSTYINITGNNFITIPDDAVEFRIRLYVNSGVTFGTTAYTTQQSILNHRGIYESMFAGKDEINNYPAALTFFAIAALYDSNNRATPADIPINSYCMTNGSRLTGWHETIDDNINYTILCYGNITIPYVRRYIIIPTGLPGILFALSNDSGQTLTYWTQKETPRVLLLGSSFGGDSTEYAPFLMEEMASDLNVIFGIAYASGTGINTYNTYFNNDTPVTYYKKKFGANSWTSGTSKTVKQILVDEKWDIILINQSAAEQGILSSYSNLNTYLWNLASYIGHPVKFGFVMAQDAIGYQTYDYDDMVTCAESIMHDSLLAFLIPCGTAIENARHTRLDDIGDSDHLAYDATGHLQEGLPVYISSLVTASKLIDELRGSNGAIIGESTVPDISWITSHNIPQQNGSPVGLANSDILLGQRCALLAIKNPLETSI